MNYKLGDLLDIVSGFAFKSGDFSDEGIPVIKIKNITPPVINILDTNKVPLENMEKYQKWLLNYNDILISMTGSNINQMSSAVGKVGRVKVNEPILLNQRVGKFEVKRPDLLDFDFLYYWISRKEIQYKLALSAGGSANQANISPNQIKNLEIELPSLRIQKVISNILVSLDVKIELNQKIILQLEELSNLLFKHWFINFEFPNEQGQPYKSNGGEMLESELGEIPKDWEVVKAKDLYDINIGKTPPRKEAYWFSKDRGIKWASISDLKSNDPYITETKEYLVNEAISRHKVKVVPKDTVLLSFKLTIGRVAITHEEMATNEAIAHFNAVENISPSFIYTYLYLKNFNYEKLGSTSSIATAVNSKIIKDMQFLVPSKPVLSNFNNIVNHIFEQIKKLQEENITLNNLRDTLLPKFLSGEIEIPDNVEVN